MPELFVVDASAAIAIIREEPEAAQIADLLRRHVARAGRVLVPSHFWLEIGNVLMRRYKFAPQQIVEELHELEILAIETVEIDRSLRLLALDRMWTHGLSAYDAAYLALAEAKDASLVTLDMRLAAAAGGRALPRPPIRLAESAVVYQGDDSADVWGRFGGYLAELRRAVAAE